MSSYWHRWIIIRKKIHSHVSPVIFNCVCSLVLWRAFNYYNEMFHIFTWNITYFFKYNPKRFSIAHNFYLYMLTWALRGTRPLKRYGSYHHVGYTMYCFPECVKRYFPDPKPFPVSTIISRHPISFSPQSQSLFFIFFPTIFLCSCERGGVNMGFTPKE